MVRKTVKRFQSSSSKRHSAVPPKGPIAPPAPVKDMKAATPIVIPQAAPVIAVAPPPTAAIAVTASIIDAAPAEVTITGELKAIDPAAVEVSPTPAEVTAVATLIASLSGVDAEVACEAATKLGALGDSSAVQPLIEVLTNAEGYYHGVVRAAAASSLAQLGDRRAVDALIHGVADPIAEASAEAIRALGELGDARAVNPLIDVIRNASGFYLSTARRAAVLALTQLGGEAANAELLAVASDASEDPVVRAAAPVVATVCCMSSVD